TQVLLVDLVRVVVVRGEAVTVHELDVAERGEEVSLLHGCGHGRPFWPGLTSYGSGLLRSPAPHVFSGLPPRAPGISARSRPPLVRARTGGAGCGSAAPRAAECPCHSQGVRGSVRGLRYESYPTGRPPGCGSSG